MSERVWMLEDARLVAGVVLHWLGDVCERIEVAGSVRREKETVKDLEIVYMPKLVMGQACAWWVRERCAIAILAVGGKA